MLEDQGRLTKKSRIGGQVCQLDTKPNRSLPIWARQENSTSSAENPEVHFEKLGKIDLYDLGEQRQV